MVSNEVYQLPLNDDGSPDVAGQYVYIAPKSKDPVTIRFTIEGTSSICRHGSLWVNIPEEGQDFHRHQFREYPYVVVSHPHPIDLPLLVHSLFLPPPPLFIWGPEV